MIPRPKHIILPLAIRKPPPQIDHRLFELFGREDLVREGGEGEVEVVGEAGGFEVVGL